MMYSILFIIYLIVCTVCILSIAARGACELFGWWGDFSDWTGMIALVSGAIVVLSLLAGILYSVGKAFVIFVL